MYKVLVTDGISQTGLECLVNHPNYIVERQPTLPVEELIKIIGEYDALIVRSQTKVTEELLQAADRLKVIARAGVGVDNIDISAATRKGIIVINAPGANTIAATEHTLAMMLSLARKIPQAHQKTSGGEWDRNSFKGVELYKKTLGVIGMGKIGTEVAKRAKSFGMNILGFDPYLTEERAKKLGIKKASLDLIAAESDFITIHTPLTNNTRGIINDEFLSKTKKGVRFVNCARGGIIDEKALVRAINTGHVAGAALDVFEKEPVTDPELLQNPNIIVTPHLGASTVEAQEKVAEEVSKEIIEIFEKQSIQNAVNMPQMSGETQAKLQPYLLLADQIGQLAIQLLKKQAPGKIEINYYGDLVDEDTELLTRTLLRGILSYHLSDSVNLINVLHLLKEQGVPYNVQKNATNKGFANYMELAVSQGEDTARIGATVLNGYGARIVKINQYRIDVKPEKYLLYIKHQDVPGMIGKVGSLLGNFYINIGTMQVGRTEVGGEAIMVLTLDKELGTDVIRELTLIDGLEEAQFLEISNVDSFHAGPAEKQKVETV
ncbi:MULTISPECIES: phosphoglycerate dehydrogenase [Neobacillus]|jgi:D-3-phosphoglycerate dehydrogenase / 2-oxoglutarate reductase|uniref:D-3-phosphoglycerate dehydrogenase n=1 Tax=Neobacillus sedimentimangrovi TaxID=2699460 RepID=A0ABS8QI72_9BACI|nr:phosphoglycerate dehydrogenase [Neobacillus sedimentimangrovi]AIM16012.1 D-3-phosphoglycerate dehydrogenase [Bacillus sp. X1(2014)]MCD4838969.1 phosphoglycerate dehydrogenase [Neobacillus sedimentimangrovi]